MNDTFQARLAHQLEATFRSGSTYVVLVIGILASIYASMSDAQQAALLSTFPFLKGYTPIVGAIAAFLATRAKPSNAVSTQTQALIAEVTRLRMNMLLKAAGQPEIPAPEAHAAALPAIPIPAPPIVAPAPIPPPPAPPPPDPALAQLQAIEPAAPDYALEAALKLLRSSRRTVDIQT